jgi:hypothetical protein
MRFEWRTTPTNTIAAPLASRVAKFITAVRALAMVSAARSESIMKAGAPWNDITAFARGSLYGRAIGTNIEIGTMNFEYGLFLELGTVNMAPRPIIVPTLNRTADQYYRDTFTLARGILVG